jgi:hypothetical protein
MNAEDECNKGFLKYSQSFIFLFIIIKLNFAYFDFADIQAVEPKRHIFVVELIFLVRRKLRRILFINLVVEFDFNVMHNDPCK